MIDLGLTSRRLHDLERLSILGKCGLTLIQPKTKDRDIPIAALHSIGKLLLFVCDVIFRRHQTHAQAFLERNEHEKKYLKRFAEQLGITDRSEQERFCIPSTSFGINTRLMPHFDSMNPTRLENDMTHSSTFIFKLTDVPHDLRGKIHSASFAKAVVPFVNVNYNRKCLDSVSSWEVKCDKFANSCVSEKENEGRRMIIEILKQVLTDRDYLGVFFSRFNRGVVVKSRFSPSSTMNGFRTAYFAEAVDKMSFWSSILHSFFVYVKVRRKPILLDDIFGFCLFLSHQCNGQITIVSALYLLVHDEIQSTFNLGKGTLYRQLARKCVTLDKRKTLEGSDLGSGQKPRFQPSDNKLYSDKQVKDATQKLKSIFAKYRNDLSDMGVRSTLNILRLSETLLRDVCGFTIQGVKSNGIGPVRGTHLIQISSLLGILPLAFYSYIPMHLGGGPEIFMTNWSSLGSTGKVNKESIIEWNATILDSLAKIFGRDFTSNFLENLTCILGRKKDKVYDIHFMLPRCTINEKELSKPYLEIPFKVCHQSGFKSHVLCAMNATDEIVVCNNDDSISSDLLFVYCWTKTATCKVTVNYDVLDRIVISTS